jgi:hypothetical protein
LAERISLMGKWVFESLMVLRGSNLARANFLFLVAFSVALTYSNLAAFLMDFLVFLSFWSTFLSFVRTFWTILDRAPFRRILLV